MWGPHHAFAFQCQKFLEQESFDVAHCMSYHDAFGAALAKRNGAKFKLIMYIVGTPVKRYFRSIPLDYAMFRYALYHADDVVMLSDYAINQLTAEYGYPGHLVNPPVNLDNFSPKTEPGDGPPTILFVGDVNEIRKGAGVLAKAFTIVKSTCPDVKLRYSGNVSENRIAQLLAEISPEHHDAVEFLGVGDVADLPNLYQTATVTVLPAIWETFGMVIVESMASGTPVVGCDHGGIPDIITNDNIGTLFHSNTLHGEPNNPEGLANALLKTLDLAKEPGTIARCTEHARSFGWRSQAAKMEALYKGESTQEDHSNNG